MLVNRYSFVEPENEQFYLVKFRCPSESEIPVRALLIQTLDLKKLRFHAIRSHHIEGSNETEIEATLFAGKEDDRLVEALVAQMSLRSGITSTSWLKLEDGDW